MVSINKHIYTLYTSLSCINRPEQTVRDMKQQCEVNKTHFIKQTNNYHFKNMYVFQ